MTGSYDEKCYDLAAAFLADWPEKNTEENRDKLASHIQKEIESEIEFILEPTVPHETLEDYLERENAKQIGSDALRAAGLKSR